MCAEQDALVCGLLTRQATYNVLPRAIAEADWQMSLSSWLRDWVCTIEIILSSAASSAREWSHLSASDSVEYTRRLSAVLERKGLL